MTGFGHETLGPLALHRHPLLGCRIHPAGHPINPGIVVGTKKFGYENRVASVIHSVVIMFPSYCRNLEDTHTLW